jgi:hypothetical protein
MSDLKKNLKLIKLQRRAQALRANLKKRKLQQTKRERDEEPKTEK